MLDILSKQYKLRNSDTQSKRAVTYSNRTVKPESIIKVVTKNSYLSHIFGSKFEHHSNG